MVCPLIVEDLSSPGQMLIEVCKGYVYALTTYRHTKIFFMNLNGFKYSFFCCRCYVKNRVSFLR